MFTELLATGLAAGVTTGALCYPTFVPASAIWGPLVSRGSASGPARVALTFDDGPLPDATDRILDVLAKHGVRAAFFVIGSLVAKHPTLVARMHAEGHLVGNHSYDHLGLGFLHGSRFWRDQLERTDAAIVDVIGLRPLLFRPPLGAKTPVMARAVRTHTVVTWTRRAFDGVETTAERIRRRLVPHTRAGEIVLLHDGLSPQTRRDPRVTVDAVGPVIEGLRARGIEPVRLDELVSLKVYSNQDLPPSP